MSSTIDNILTEVGKAFLPLETALSSTSEFEGFMREMGWSTASIPAPINNLLAAVTTLKTSIENIVHGDPDASDFENAANALEALYTNIQNLDSAVYDAALVLENFANIFPEQLIHFQLATYLLRHQPAIGYLFRVLGVLKVEYQIEAGNRPAYQKYSFIFSNITEVLKDPVVIFENAFNWGNSDFKSNEVFQIVNSLFNAMGISSFIAEIDDYIAKPLGEIEQPGDPVSYGVNIPFFDAGSDITSANAGLLLLELPENGPKKPGLALIPYVNGSLSKDFQISEYLVFNLSTDLNVSGGIGIKLRPGSGLELVQGINDSAVPLSARGSLEVSIITRRADMEPIILIGSKGGTRLQMGSLSGTGGIILDSNEDPDLYTELALDEGKLVIAGGEGDGFLQKILPENGIEIGFDLTLGYSTKRGVYFKGSGGLEVNTPVHLSLGPIEIQSVTAAIKFSGDGIPIELGTSIKAELGPLIATIENMGVKAIFTFPNSGGNLGPLNLGIDFKPPSGIGLVIDGEGFVGGGYLSFDFDNERYSGILELEFQGTFSLKAIGLLTTKMPDGSKGFSLLIIITSDFTPIQLGYGFTLNGVGGLLGLNRTMKVEELRKGVKSGALNSVLFPTDIVANANKIISDLRTIFPPQEGKFVFGPMAKIGWGTPSLLTLELGLLIEVPSPVRIAILGVLRAILPHEEAAIIKIQVNFLGTVEFDKKLIAFDASLFDSFILAFTLEGDMALRVSYGENPDFLMSIGGFHPSYTPPPLELPQMTRLTISLLGGNNPRLTLTAYQALTSNTVQFGAAIELYAKAWKFSVYGFLGFDILIQFNPFYFIASVGAMLAVKAGSSTLFSIKLAFTLEGPTPWKAKGTASFKILFVKIKVKFNKTFGEKKDTSLPEVAIIPLLQEALSNKGNWEGKLQVANNLLVTLRDIESETDGVVVHPAGTLQVSQKLAPLNIKIDQVGSQKPSDASKITIDVDAAISGDLTRSSYVKEQFAPAQFFELSDAEKLSRKSFEKLDGGITLTDSNNAINFSYFVKRDVEFETIVIDNNYKRLVLAFQFILSIFSKFLLKGTAISKSSLSKNYKLKIQPEREKIRVIQEGFSVLTTDDLSPAAENFQWSSETEAINAMNEMISADRNLKSKIHVVPNYQVNQL